jgi:hypothetical protein
MKSVHPTYRALVVQMVLPLGLVQEWKALTLVRTCMVLVNCTSFDAQYAFDRAQIFRRDVVWAKYKALIVTKISSHCLVIFIPALKQCHGRNNTEGLQINIYSREAVVFVVDCADDDNIDDVHCQL